jgi:Mitochondrial ATP synthase epsilon chain
MQQKKDSSVGSGAQARNRKGLSFEDKYICLQQENHKLKQQFRKICDALSFWKWSALEAQAERDSLKEQLQEQAQERRNHE